MRDVNRRHFLAVLMSACALPARADVPRLRALLGGYQTSAMLVLRGGKNLFEYGDLARTASGAFGQFITVVPKLDMVVAHKVMAPSALNVPAEDYLHKILPMALAPA